MEEELARSTAGGELITVVKTLKVLVGRAYEEKINRNSTAR